MTQWIQSSNTLQDGSPVTRNIKIPEMDKEIWFTENAYAEVADSVADVLAAELDAINKVSEPATPGSYYGDAGQNTTVEVVLADESFSDIYAETATHNSVKTEDAQIKLYAERIQLSEYATSGSGTDSDPFKIDLADVFNDSDVTQETGLVVDGIFEVASQQDVPPQFQFIGNAGRDTNNRGSVIRAETGFSEQRAVKFVEGDTATLDQRNFGGAVGVFFDGNEEVDDLILTSSGVRNRFFYRCSFRRALGNALDVRNRKVSFIDCDIGDMINSGNALAAYIKGTRQCTFRSCRFATNDKDVELVIQGGTKEIMFDDCTFANHHYNPSFRIQDNSGGTVDPEAVLNIRHCRWTDFGDAVNALKIGQGNAAEVAIPMHFSHLFFDGTNREDGTATGNKAINFPSGTAPRGIHAHDLDAKNFTNSPVIDFGADLDNVRHNQTVELSSTPSASNWDTDDAGVTIIDKSSTADPYDRYTVLNDGTLDGPY